jgi:hypothetical protein
METVTAILDFLRLALAVGLGVFIAEGSLAFLVTWRAFRARKKKLAVLKKYENELRDKGKLTNEDLKEAAEALIGGLGG